MINHRRFYLIPLLLSLTTLIYAAPTMQQRFFKQMVPMIHKANRAIQAQRQRLIQLQQRPSLNGPEKVWIIALAKQYKISIKRGLTQSVWRELDSKVDILPTSLVLAQAINESAWGRSRFARQGNNYFGQWCYRQGCGIVPLRRAAGETHEVKRFASAYDSISAYMRNLNASAAYDHIRTIRTQLRTQQKKLSSISLARGLIHYSQRGAGYVPIIQQLVSRYRLQRFDKFTQVAVNTG